MRTITLNGEKGGITKTTQAIHIAAGLAIKGERVLLIDADPQGHSTWSLGLDKTPSLYDVLVRQARIVDMLRLIDPDVYASGQPAGKLYVLPGNAETRLIAEYVDDADVLHDQLERIEGIDTVIIDTAPTASMLMAIIYAATDYVITPTQFEALSMQGMDATILRARKADTPVLAISPSLYEKGTYLHSDNLQILKQYAATERLPMFEPIPKRTDWREASQVRKTVFRVFPHKPVVRDAWRLVEQVQEALKAHA